MAKNYYLILGVPSDAAPDTIRSAFRERAKRLHPDRGGPPGGRPFLEATEAYEVLSDPDRRAHYDRKLRAAARDLRPARELEPLVRRATPVTGQPELVRPSFEALVDRLIRNFAAGDAPKAERMEPLDFELVLSTEEAELGTVIPFVVPVLSVCRDCAGTGTVWAYACPRCDGAGRVTDQKKLPVRIPPRVADGTVIEVSMDSLGVTNLWLRVHVRVSPH